MKRRTFIVKSAQLGTGSLLGLSLFNRCKESDPCDDLSNLTQDEIEERKSYNYVKESPHKAQNCLNCELYIEPEEGNPCGGCGLFEGPVQANGYCDSWIMKEG
jgi:hypothetical protein